MYIYIYVMQQLHLVSGHPVQAKLGPEFDGIRGQLSRHKGVSLRYGDDAISMHYLLPHGLHRPTITDMAALARIQTFPYTTDVVPALSTYWVSTSPPSSTESVLNLQGKYGATASCGSPSRRWLTS